MRVCKSCLRFSSTILSSEGLILKELSFITMSSIFIGRYATAKLLTLTAKTCLYETLSAPVKELAQSLHLTTHSVPSEGLEALKVSVQRHKEIALGLSSVLSFSSLSDTFHFFISPLSSRLPLLAIEISPTILAHTTTPNHILCHCWSQHPLDIIYHPLFSRDSLLDRF